MHIGEIVKKRRLELGYTRQHLSRLVGKSVASIKKYETAEIDMPCSVLSDICKALKMEVRFVKR